MNKRDLLGCFQELEEDAARGEGGAFSGGVSTDITVLVGYIQSQPFFFFLNILVSFPCLSHHLDMEAF